MTCRAPAPAAGRPARCTTDAGMLPEHTWLCHDCCDMHAAHAMINHMVKPPHNREHLAQRQALLVQRYIDPAQAHRLPFHTRHRQQCHAQSQLCRTALYERGCGCALAFAIFTSWS